MAKRARWSEEYGPGYARRLATIRALTVTFSLHRSERRLVPCLTDLDEMERHIGILRNWVESALREEE